MKESQSLARIPDTLVCAMEFITLATPSEQAASLEELRKEVLRSHVELKVWFLPQGLQCIWHAKAAGHAACMACCCLPRNLASKFWGKGSNFSTEGFIHAWRCMLLMTLEWLLRLRQTGTLVGE